MWWENRDFASQSLLEQGRSQAHDVVAIAAASGLNPFWNRAGLRHANGSEAVPVVSLNPFWNRAGLRPKNANDKPNGKVSQSLLEQGRSQAN